MTELLDQAVAAVRQMPAQDQDEIARTLLEMAHGPGPGEAATALGGAVHDVERRMVRGAPTLDERETLRLWPRRRRWRRAYLKGR